MEDYNIEFEIDAESQKKIFEMFNQKREDGYKCIQQHSDGCWQEIIKNKQQNFEECWQETINNKIQLDEKTSEEGISFIKSVFLYGCNVGWNDCYTFHEDLIQKGLNQQ